ncbi:class I SAM-dependent methyltransferase [Trichloromonas sp.]|uniref:class I SAM-dependent methyltransferase n=1 Tax=Trichloromonas sp. TaxID=3069249 RepID=UPI003D813E42
MRKVEGFVDYQKNGWDSFFKSKGDGWRNKDYIGLSRVFDLSALNGSLLDVGCALGDGFMFLQTHCPDVTHLSGSDFSEYAIDKCRNKPCLKFVDFFIHNIEDSFTGKYDNVICLQTLEHVSDPVLALQNLIAATNQVLIVATPYKNRRPDENHLWVFDEEDFVDLLDDYCLDKKKKNIYWILDKQKKGLSFRKSGKISRILKVLRIPGF